MTITRHAASFTIPFLLTLGGYAHAQSTPELDIELRVVREGEPLPADVNTLVLPGPEFFLEPVAPAISAEPLPDTGPDAGLAEQPDADLQVPEVELPVATEQPAEPVATGGDLAEPATPPLNPVPTPDTNDPVPAIVDTLRDSGTADATAEPQAPARVVSPVTEPIVDILSGLDVNTPADPVVDNLDGLVDPLVDLPAGVDTDTLLNGLDPDAVTGDLLDDSVDQAVDNLIDGIREQQVDDLTDGLTDDLPVNDVIDGINNLLDNNLGIL